MQEEDVQTQFRGPDRAMTAEEQINAFIDAAGRAIAHAIAAAVTAETERCIKAVQGCAEPAFTTGDLCALDLAVKAIREQKGE